MGQSTFVNSRGIVHKGSGGTSIVFPDVCKTPTPGGPVPIPYPNIGKSSDTSNGPRRVRIDGQMPMVRDATYRMSSGDEAGSIGGVASGTVMGECRYMLYSFNVKIEGRNVCRLGDMLFQNKRNIMG